jgi:hypothetical protein
MRVDAVGTVSDTVPESVSVVAAGGGVGLVGLVGDPLSLLQAATKIDKHTAPMAARVIDRPREIETTNSSGNAFLFSPSESHARRALSLRWSKGAKTLRACNKTPIATRRLRASMRITKHWAT